LAASPSITYYYYTGILCGGSTTVPFRSTDPSLADNCAVAKLYCDVCGGTIQCFDNISPSFIPNTNDLIACYDSCLDCNNSPAEPSQTPTQTATQTPTVTPTPTQTPTQTATQTQTPSQTATQTQTPSQTATQTQTPSTTSIKCGLGVTTGSYYYTDCCGNFIQGSNVGITVSMDYTKNYLGITKLNVTTSQSCPTPTPTATPTQTTTPTITPTNTITPTKTPSVTKTPTPTPSNRPAVRLANNCDVFTLFNLGVTCYTIQQPTSPTSNDGILSLKVTGGTSPYSYYWSNGQRSQTLVGVSQGDYVCTVVDYYGDYTATTVCSLFAPTAAPTSTPTMTPTVTPSGTCPKLCFLAYNNDTTYGLWQFTCNGLYNNRTTWTYNGNINIVWSGTKWTMVSSDMVTPFVAEGGGIFSSTDSSNVPLSSWTTLGGTSTYTISVTEGNCPLNLPLQTNVITQNSTCDGNQNCDGNISVATKFGVPPYLYSINNGLTLQTSNFFFNLCPNTYTVITTDSLNNTNSNIVTIGYNQNPTTYQVSINLLSNLTETTNGNNNTTKTTYFTVTTNPAIPVGTTLSFYLNFSSVKTINGPGTGVITDNIMVYNNGNLLTSVNPSTSVTTNTRPNCSPEIQTVTTESESYYCELTSTGTVTGSTQSVLDITSGEISVNSCVTELNQTIYLGINNTILNGCSCCSVVADTNPYPVIDNSVSYTNNSQPSQTYYSLTIGVGTTQTNACSDYQNSPTRTINSSTFGPSVTIYGGNPTNPQPLLGFNYCVYNYGLYYMNSNTGVVGGPVLGTNNSIILC